jgi:uncharacterized protein DUF3365
MKKVVILVLMGFVVGLVNAEQQQLIEHSRQLIAEYAAKLKTELQTSLENDGPMNAISHCQAAVPKINIDSIQDGNWSVGRTALKYRSPDNKPDDWELEVLNWFETRKQQGEDISQLEFSATVEKNGGSYFRYMKAIPTQKICQTCHGEKLAEPLAQKISELYPQDSAKGFKQGDIRGAFTVSHKLD